MREIAVLALLAFAAFSPMARPVETSRLEYQSALRAVPNLEHGQLIFTTCAMCHGIEGGGNSERGVPRIGGQLMSVIVRQLVDYRHGARWDDRMEAFTDRHMLRDAQEIADVAAYVSQLPVSTKATTGNGDLLEHGSKVFARRCAGCHGQAAGGDSRKAVPKLAGQHYQYLLRQLYDAVDGRRPNFDAAHVRLLKRMDRDDFTSIADHLSRLP